MLVLTRRPGQTLVIDGGRIVIKLIRVQGNCVRLGIAADRDLAVVRGELLETDAEGSLVLQDDGE